MQFQHPELLWGLLLLIIPILVHLLRLRRFRKTQFTNVRILQRIFAESNKSSQVKRWLLLLSRLGLLASLVFAFCQPYKKSDTAELHKDIIVYLDNSLSMQARQNNTSLLQYAVQEILQFFPEDLTFTLLTQSERYPDVRIRDIQQQLLELEFSAKPLSSEDLRFRAEGIFARSDSSARHLWIFSDFVQWDARGWEEWGLAQVSAVQMRAESTGNAAIDTAYIQADSPENRELMVQLSFEGEDQNLPVSLYNGDSLIAKTGGEPTRDGGLEARFSLPEIQNLNGTLQISDEGLTFDNLLYITINRPQKIEVLSIGPKPSPFLGRIFTEETFNLKQSSLRELDYGTLDEQHLIILNELEAIPNALFSPLSSFVREGGSLVVIPAFDAQLGTYEPLLSALRVRLGARIDGNTLITQINFEHPLFRDVFEKRIENFEYPKTSAFFPLTGSLPQVIGLQNGQPFLAGREGIYLFTSPLSGTYSNFRQSPLIVPSLYAIGRGSQPAADLYYQIGEEAQLDIDIALQEDDILELRSSDYSFIPRQQSFARKTRLYFLEEPEKAGNYRIENRGEFLQSASFNYSRAESAPNRDAVVPPTFEEHTSAESLVSQFQNDNRITSLWKWFVILALLFVLVELILQKTMR
jgi:hypothetical protein